MDILFLALGGTRRRAVLDESAEVVAAGGSAVILIGDRHVWRRETFPADVRVIELGQLEQDHLPLRLERAVLFKVPRRLLSMVGRGPLRKPAKRASKAYERRLANKVHRRVLPLYHRVWKDRHHQVILSTVRASAFDAVTVADFSSLPYAARLAKDFDTAKGRSPAICYSIGQLGF